MPALDIALPLPLPLIAAKLGLVATFVLHILFVNLMVGGSLIALSAHWRGRRDPELLAFTPELLDAVTFHKSLAVVLGVGPLLLLSVAYTGPFYTSSVLIAPFWLAALALIVLAFGALYAYKFGWKTTRLTRPRRHAAYGLVAGLLFWLIPLIYLTNTQLMLDASALTRQTGFFEAMRSVGNVGPRYAHFMLASLAIGGLWIALAWRSPKIKRFGTHWALWPNVAQLLAGPWVLATLPAHALDVRIGVELGVAMLAGLAAIGCLISTLRGRDLLKGAAALLAVTVVLMGVSRHEVRERLLAQPATPGTIAQEVR